MVRSDRLRIVGISEVILSKGCLGVDPGITCVLSLGLIGNASGRLSGRSGVSIRGVFDKEARRKPLAFAADALLWGLNRLSPAKNTIQSS